MLRGASHIAGDLRGAVSTGVRAVRTRLELFAIELKEEKAWLIRSLVVAISALYLLTFGLLMGVLAVVFYAPEENRPTILAACAAGFVIAGLGGALFVWMQARSRQPVFSETIKVLKGDESALEALPRGAGD